MIIRLIAGQIKKTQYKIRQYSPKLYKRYSGNVKVELDPSKYLTTIDLKKNTEC